MQGSFEKKVQEKLDELKLTPSAPVWEKVEQQIRPEKKRRRAFFWLPLGMLLMIGGGWWLWNGDERKSAAISGQGAETVTTSAPTEMPSPITITTPTPADKEVQKVTTIRKEEKLPAQQTPTIAGKANNVIGDNNPSRPPIKFPVTAKATKSSRSSGTGLQLPSTKKTLTVPAERSRKATGKAIEKNTTTETGIEPLPHNKASNPVTVQDATATEKKSTIPDAFIANADSAAAEKKPELSIKDSAATKRKIAALKKWKVTVTAQVGWNGPATSQPSVYADAYASPSQNAGGVFAGPISPNAVNGGMAYSVGVGLSRSISNRLQVSAGLQYTTYQARTKVGAFRPLDTSLFFRSQSLSVGGYYRNGQQQDYTIRHQVLELPVSISYQPLRSLPLLVTAGASYGRLLKSNALTYNRSGNFYFENKENLSRHQVGLFSAIQYPIIRKGSFALSAGPALQYGLTSFQKEAGMSKPKLLFAGLKTNINF